MYKESVKLSKVWLLSKKLDLLVLFFPVWFCWIFFFITSDAVSNQEVPLWCWVVVVLGIDVSHVWSTIYRTYFDAETRVAYKQKLLLIPLLVFILALAVNSYSVELFWRLMAYLALYHFIKQQYGFLSFYKAKNKKHQKKWLPDKPVMYFSMLYPVVYWHFASKINFAWFVEGDFILMGDWLDVSFLWPYLNVLYWGVILFWLFEETYLNIKEGCIQYGKVLWLLSTAVNWYLGIVYFNSDVVFTVTNVVAHGVPYLALTFVFYIRRGQQDGHHKKSSVIAFLVLGMFVLVLCLGFVEELFWDVLVNKDKEVLFGFLWDYSLTTSQQVITQNVAVALLAVPQVTHYILDGYVWKPGVKNKIVATLLLK